MAVERDRGGDAGERVVSDVSDVTVELARVQQRESHYRELLAAAQRELEAAQRLNDTLFRLSARPADESRALEEIVAASAAALGVARTGLWLATPALDAIDCEILVSEGEVKRRPGVRIARSAAPHYFDAVLSGRVLSVPDVRAHGATQELRPYATEHGIGALLDVPVRIAGEVAGILCHEHVGAPRTFGEREKIFAANVADLAALAIEHERSEHARAEQREAEARYKHLVESLPVVVYSFDSKGALDYVSPSIRALAGQPSPHWLGEIGLERWLARIHDDDRPAVERRLERGPGDAGRAVEYRIRDDDGAERWVRDTYNVVRNAEGKPVGVQGVIEEVTERVLADRSRAEWERRFRSMLASVELIAVMLDARGRVTYVNSYFLELTGLAEADVVGADWFTVVLPRNEVIDENLVHGAGADGRSTQELERAYETRLRDAGGRTHLVRWSNTVLRAVDRQVVGMASLGIDLTEREELERRARRDEAEETLGRLAAGVAHDLTNALAGLQLTVDVLRGPAANDTGVRREALASLEACAERATELTRGLLDVARDRPSDPRRLDLNQSLEVGEPLLRALTSERPTVLSIKPAPEPVIAVVDPGQLQRVLLNLVANARDALREGGHIELRAARVFLDETEAGAIGLDAGAYCLVEVEDDGTGIPEPLLPRVFEPYFTTKENEGTGLGLAASRAMIRRAGGTITVESRPGRTIFGVYLPAAR